MLTPISGSPPVCSAVKGYLSFSCGRFVDIKYQYRSGELRFGVGIAQ